MMMIDSSPQPSQIFIVSTADGSSGSPAEIDLHKTHVDLGMYMVENERGPSRKLLALQNGTKPGELLEQIPKVLQLCSSSGLSGFCLLV